VTSNDGDADAMMASQVPRVEESETEVSTPDKPEPDDDELPLDVVFGILKNRRRRLVLQYLVDVSETSTLGHLAEYIAGIENEKPEEALTSSERKRVYVALYQSHFPKMDDVGVIDFESNRGTVELADNVEQFTRYLNGDEETSERDWITYYAMLVAAGGALFVTQQLLFPADVFSGVIIGVLIGLCNVPAMEYALGRGAVLPDWFGRERQDHAVSDAE